MAAPSFTCRKCAEILRAQSHLECGGCCKKLHLVCSALSGDEYHHLRRVPKLRWICVVCSDWAKTHKQETPGRPARPQSMYWGPDQSNQTGSSFKRSKSSSDLKMIDSISSAFDEILKKLKDLKYCHSKMVNQIEKITTQDVTNACDKDSDKASISKAKKKVVFTDIVEENSSGVDLDDVGIPESCKTQSCQITCTLTEADKIETSIELDRREVLDRRKLMSRSCEDLTICGDFGRDDSVDDIGRKVDEVEISMNVSTNDIVYSFDSRERFEEHGDNGQQPQKEHEELIVGESEEEVMHTEIMNVLTNDIINSFDSRERFEEHGENGQKLQEEHEELIFGASNEEVMCTEIINCSTNDIINSFASRERFEEHGENGQQPQEHEELIFDASDEEVMCTEIINCSTNDIINSFDSRERFEEHGENGQQLQEEHEEFIFGDSEDEEMLTLTKDISKNDTIHSESAEERCSESAMVAQLQSAQLSDWMDPAEAARQQRIARYKEERRRQLDAQYGRPQESASSSSSGGGLSIRSTRASRLRSAAVAATPDGGKAVLTPRREAVTEKKEVNGRLGPTTPTPEVAKDKSPLTLSDTSSSPGPRKERDKSSKRKSNLNRSLNAEPVKDSSEDVVRRRRNVGASPAQSPAKCPRATPASAPATESDTPRPVSSRVYKRTTPPRDNPRPRPRSSSGLLEKQGSVSETATAASTAPVVNGACSPASPANPAEPLEVTPDVPSLPDVVVLSSRPSSILKKKSLDETFSTSPPTTAVGKPVSILKRKTSQEEGSASGSQPVTFSPSVVEPVARRQGILKKHCSLDEGRGGTGLLARRSASPDKPILKQQRRSSLEDLRRRTRSPEPQSILKRKTSRDEAMEALATSEPQGILKRKTSSSSGPVHMTIAETVILAVAGDDSLADDHVRPILKKKTSLCEDPPGLSQDSGQSTEPPRPILKKKSSSETEDSEDKPMKPILKSRRDSGRVSESRNSSTDRETQEVHAEERPLQNGTGSREESLSAFSARAESSSPERSVVVRRIANSNIDDLYKRRSFDSSVRFKDESHSSVVQESSLPDVERVKITESGTDSREESLSAFSARAESSSPERSVVVRRIANSNIDDLYKRRSLDSSVRFKEESHSSVVQESSLPVVERVMIMESFFRGSEAQRPRSQSPTQIQGAVPKRRDRERCRTQPITVQELNNSRTWSRDEGVTQAEETCQGMDQEEPHPLTRSDSVSARASLFEAHLKQMEDETKPKRVLRDLALDNLSQLAIVLLRGAKQIILDLCHKPRAPINRFTIIWKSILKPTRRHNERFAESSAARRVKLDPSRFQTQPVTQGEVEEAKRASANDAVKPSSDGEDDPNDPSKLSLAERVQLFNRKMSSERGVARSARYRTQPVTPDELEKAQRLAPISRTASSVLVSGILKNLTEKNEGPKSKVRSLSDSEEENVNEPPSPQKRGILKSPSQGWRMPKPETEEESPSVNLKSVLKKENKKGAELERRSKDLHSILKVSRDKESSSSEETESESEDDKPNANSDLIDLLHKVEAQARGERRIATSPERKKVTSMISNNRKPEESDKLMNLKNLDQGKENYDVTRRTRRKRADGAELSEGDSSSSGGREVRKIIGNEAIARRRQAGLAREAAERVKKGSAEGALSKSRSHSTMNGDVVVRPPSGAEPLPLRRCRTQPMDECDEPVTNGVSIAQRLQALQKSGQTDWKKRISRLNPEEELTTTISINAAAEVLKERLATSPRSPVDAPPPTTPLDERLGLLESSTQGWRRRVNPSDATQFSVAGRMAAVPPSPLPSPATERKKKIPKPERFRSKGIASKDVQSMPTSPEAETTSAGFKRSISAPGDDDKNSLSSVEGDVATGPLVSVPKAFDDDFSKFFKSSASDERIELRDEDLETVTCSTSQLLVQRRTVKVQRRHGASSNPVKALAARTDLRTEYVEVKSGVAHREEKRLRVEKLAKNSSMAVEALAGLASQEDFAAVQLRKAAESTAHLSPMLPYKELMLLQVKGRRHVQTRLVQPHYSSINQGDSYVLVTPTQVFHWVGEFSNVIERSRGAEIAQHIAQTRDLGCTATQVTTVQGNTPHTQFWKLLGADEDIAANYTGAAPGHPDEDELYELALTGTNMIYEVEGEELVPRMDCWGSMPKIEILDHNKVLVLDFGSELYVWMGKTVTLERRRTALRLGQELWGQGYNYSECDVCPLTQAQSLGTRTGEQSVEKSADKRPDWALLAKVTQHMETVLLREKFLDWPDFSRVIQVKTREKDKQVEASVEVKPCDAQPMVNWEPPEPDLQLEGSHLGRGTKFYDPETHRHFEVTTLSVTAWHVQEFGSTELDSASLGQLHSGDSYVIRWCYSVTVTGRELTGAPSRHSTVGRDRCCYWTWQGAEASTNDKGAAALLTVQLDQERGPQLRLTQGQEPPAFRQLFDGGFIVHHGRRSDGNSRPGRWRLYLAKGEVEGEAVLTEVACSLRQLRSRACLVLLDTEDGQAYLWRGAQALSHTHAVALAAVNKLKERLPAEAGLEDFEEIDVEEISEGEEPKLFFEALGGHSRQLYVSLPKCAVPMTHTPRLFRLTSVSGVFEATPVTPVCHHYPSLASPFPYTQHDLYSARQPALFLLDAGSALWLWQGWWEEERGEEDEGVVGGWVGEVRWQAERRAAMRTTLEYCSLRSPAPSAHLVWAGLEPLHFTNLFPTWTDRDDIAEVNIRDGHKPGEVLPVQAELERLTVSVYPPAQLLQRPLPEGVDPTRLEEYLAPNHFKEVLGLSQEEFSELPAWKQNKLKQEKGLF